MEPSTIVLIITGILGLLGIFIIVVSIILTQQHALSIAANEVEKTTIISPYTCSGQGLVQLAEAPSYKRQTYKSTCITPLSISAVPFSKVIQPVAPLHRVRSIKEKISPNHWVANSTFNNIHKRLVNGGFDNKYDDLLAGNIFNLFPYIATIHDTGFSFLWPQVGSVTQKCPDIKFSSQSPLSNEPASIDVNTTTNGVNKNIVDVKNLNSTKNTNYKSFRSSFRNNNSLNGCGCTNTSTSNQLNNSIAPINDATSGFNNSITPINNAVPNFNNSITPINDQLNNINNPINSINDQLNNVNNAINPINDQLNNVNNPINPINDQLNNVNNVINPINDQLNNIDNPINPINDQLNNINNAINPINDQLNNINNAINPINDQLNNVNNPIAPINDQLNDINNAINPINDQLNNVNNPINPINDQLNNINNPINPINDQLNNVNNAIAPINDQLNNPNQTNNNNNQTNNTSNSTSATQTPTLTCPTGGADLYYNVNQNNKIIFTSLNSIPVSCDIVDIDALVTTTIWQYRHVTTRKISSMTIYMAKGSPFITASCVNMNLDIMCQNLNIQAQTVGYIYTVQNPNISTTAGYLMVTSTQISPQISNDIIALGNFTGVLRMGYYDNNDNMQLLLNNYNLYPIESTIGCNVQKNGNINDVDVTFQWTTKEMFPGLSNTLLMYSLPHHNLNNVIHIGDKVNHALVDPIYLTTTKDNIWTLQESITDYNFTYEPLNDDNTTILTNVWVQDGNQILDNNPIETVKWCEWLGTIALWLLIGNMLGQVSDPSYISGLDTLKNNLMMMISGNGFINSANQFVYDRSWGGILGKLGLYNCMGTSDDGNSFYESHINQYGYLVFAFGVAGHLDANFFSNSKVYDSGLYFVRNIMNPCQDDKYFPLWRNKDWYFGYSINSGLNPNQTMGKESYNMGSSVFGYYGCYLFGLSTAVANGNNSKIITDWSLAMLATEISSVNILFQYSSMNFLNKLYVPPEFVQGTIAIRGDSYYNYTVKGGDLLFPNRNASIVAPLIKPLSLISNDYINKRWGRLLQQWLPPVGTTSSHFESTAYALALQSIDKLDNKDIVNQIVAYSENNIPLPYGTIWSSVLYWVYHS